MPNYDRFLPAFIASSLLCVVPPVIAKDVTPLQIDAPAPELDLPGVDSKTYRLEDFADAKALVVVFTCNHLTRAGSNWQPAAVL